MADTADLTGLVELQKTLYTSGNYTRRRLHQTRLRWISDAIRMYSVQPGLMSAEYGPGSGIYLPLLARRSVEVVAADVEHAYLDGVAPLARELPNLRLATDDVQDSRFGDNTFGLVLCTEVLEHVPDPETALRTLHRILKPGGIAVVSTPQRYSAMELCCKVAFLPGVIDLVRAIYREPILPTGHISLRSSRAFRQAIDASGFHVVQQEKFGLYVPLLAEFGGELGGRVIERMEALMRRTPLDMLFWTQAYVLRKPSA